jgi:hypothetical protein
MMNSIQVLVILYTINEVLELIYFVYLDVTSWLSRGGDSLHSLSKYTRLRLCTM